MKASKFISNNSGYGVREISDKTIKRDIELFIFIAKQAIEAKNGK